jgi:hypothetical protein
VIDAVAAEKPTLPVNEKAIERIHDRILSAFPGYRFGVFLNIGLPAEWERQSKAAKAAGGGTKRR